jgi:hypothetical protein
MNQSSAIGIEKYEIAMITSEVTDVQRIDGVHA